jgi:hypothetical protein
MKTERIEDQRFYFQVWKKVLAELLGYTETQADEWIKLNRTSWDTYYQWYLHEPPEFWVLDALISSETREKIGAAEVAKLKRDIVQTIEQGNFGWFSESYNWSEARERIKKVFTNYGVSSHDKLL